MGGLLACHGVALAKTDARCLRLGKERGWLAPYADLAKCDVATTLAFASLRHNHSLPGAILRDKMDDMDKMDSAKPLSL